MNRVVIYGAIGVHVLFSVGQAATYYVGPSRSYTTVQAVAGLLNPGDTVLVDGNATYPADINLRRNGTATMWITVRGVQPSGGSRPRVTGAVNYGFNITADYIVVEGFDVDGGPKGIGVFGHNIIIRNCYIHNCHHGLIGYGTGTGNVTVEYCEFYNNGITTGGATQHQIYMATDEIAHPGAVFRLQFCYIHDGSEGDNVKSRAERNEIYYNWIENAGTVGHGLGLFAPDPEDNSQVQINTAREDADVVGNVIIQPRNSCARIGGDIPGYPTNGRYRFVNNTMILTGSRGDAIRTFNTVETLEMYNNVIYATQSGADIRVLNDADGTWLHSPRSVIGANNWVVSIATRVPTEWTGTIRGSSSPFVNADTKDFRPLESGPLVNAGAASTPTIATYPFPNPLFPPAYHPPMATLLPVGTAMARPQYGALDIGAFELAPATVSRHPPVTLNSRKVVPPGAATVRIPVFGMDGRVRAESAGFGPDVHVTGMNGSQLTQCKNIR